MAVSAACLREQVSPPADPQRPATDGRPGAVGSAVTAGDEQFLRPYARSHLALSPYQLVVLCTIAWVATNWVSLAAILPGSALIAASLVVESSFCRKVLRGVSTATAPSRWRLRFTVVEFVQGTGWLVFALPFLLRPAGEAGVGASDVFILLATLFAAGMAAVLRAPLPGVLGAALAPLALLLAFVLSRGWDAGYGTLALLVFTGQLLLARLVHRLHGAAAANVRACAQIRASFAELEQIAASTSAAYCRAEEADRARTQFFATMSHELRTPLNAILGFSEVMKNEVLGTHSTPSYREYASDIHGSGQHLLALINEILDLARLQAGHYALSEEILRLDDVIVESLAAVASAVDAKSLRVTTVFDETMPGVEADGRALRQIVGNLLSNAVKFTPRGGHIAVKAGWTSLGGQYVSVRDNGPGIPEDEIPLVLSSFGRGSLAVSTAAQG